MAGSNGINRAVCLFSGGLDSRLAARLVLDQGIDLIALHFQSVFAPEGAAGDISGIAGAARELGMELELQDISEELISLVEAPPHGHGSRLNPCIDCRILQLRRARRMMEAKGAGFMVTGEVAGQRPMTQRKDMMRHIDKEAGVTGLVLRPLCALVMDPTRPEETGLIDRNRLCGFSGRTRTPQMQLAEQLGIEGYPPPAGGCRLTEPGYARRLGDMLKHGGIRREDLPLLLVGRHFRLDGSTRLIVGRKHEENERLKKLASGSDAILQCRRFPGPTALLRGIRTEENLHCAARITARYGKGRDKTGVEVGVTTDGGPDKHICVRPAGQNEFDALLI